MEKPMQFLCEPVFGRMEVTRLGILQSTEVQSGSGTEPYKKKSCQTAKLNQEARSGHLSKNISVLEKVQQKGIFGKSVHEEGEQAGGSLMRLVVVLQDRQPGQRTVEKNCPALDNSSRST